MTPPAPEALEPVMPPTGSPEAAPLAAPVPAAVPEVPSEPSDAAGAETEEAPLSEPRPPPRPKGVAPELPLRVESLLFAAGKPVSVHDLVASLGGTADHVLVQRALRRLQRAYTNRNTSLEVRKAGDAWALQVRQDYLEVAHSVTPVDIPARSLRVLALIAYHQPIRQSLLARMVGEAAYTEVKTLKDLGFVHAVPKASTLELTTSQRFAQYFGLESTEKPKIREFLEKRLGINPTAPSPPLPPSGSDPPVASRSEAGEGRDVPEPGGDPLPAE